MIPQAKAYLVGGGIGSLAAAAFLIRDGQMPGENITILEELSRVGGSLDGAGNPASGYSLRGGRMFTTDNYECTWGLFGSIPSLDQPGQSVLAETIAFNEKHHSHSRARLIDRQRAIVPVKSMGFAMRDRLELLKLCQAPESALGASAITAWLSPAFFRTGFWAMWATTFAFQPWHSAVEFRRYLHRFMLEFTRIDTLAGVKRTIFNQYDSLVRPLQAWLEGKGVRIVTGCRVVALDHRIENGVFVVTGIPFVKHGKNDAITVKEGDGVFVQNGSMTDASSLGSMVRPPSQLTRADSGGWALWEKLADGRPQFGRPEVFNRCIAESCWESFTVTLKSPDFFARMEKLSGNEAGTGGLVTFRDSAWLMSIVLPFQPHFSNQPADVKVFWGYALFPDRVGDFVAKPMAECNGAEILQELCGHLRFDLEVMGFATCIPCRMPYITSMFLPRSPGDRPPPVPADSRNLAFISQFVEIPDDVVFTVEYSIRAAQLAVYALLGLDRKVPPVTPHDHSIEVQVEALIKSFE